MPLTSGACSSWTTNTGCSIAEQGEDFVYLGMRSGCKIDEKVVVEEIIKKLMKRITHWSIRAGKPKTSLIAWWKLGLRKEEGGLNWIPLRNRAEAMLLLPSGQIKNALVLNRMLKNWFRIRKFLRRTWEKQEIPVTFSVRQLGQVAHLYVKDGNRWAHKAVKIILALGCTEGIHIWDHRGDWRQITEMVARSSRVLMPEDRSCIAEWDNWLKKQTPSEKPITEVAGWSLANQR
ncbi:hypothetical protein R1sor_002032 [Riccia sorocarpa]|uniref:Uncharacterized protein n=1 Tax=Riccia sorocarpa TaxID=122646 RepID=A0ABD3H105_9MARC